MLGITNHHAYALSGGAELLPGIILALKEELTFTAQGNPDFWQGVFETFGIEESRLLTEASSRRAVAGDRKVFVMIARSMTREAQNALLKTLEEPSAGSLFFIIVPSIELLLPTLRSRVSIISAVHSADREAAKEAKEFLSASVPERLKLVAVLLKETEEEGRGRRTLFLHELTRLLGETREAKTEQRGALANLLKSVRYAEDRSPSFKLIFEQLALTLPRI